HDDDHDQEERIDAAHAGPATTRLLHWRNRRLAPADFGDEWCCGRVQAARVIALLKIRRDLLANDSRRVRVGDRALQPVADLDADLLLLNEHEEDQTVVVLLVAE